MEARLRRDGYAWHFIRDGSAWHFIRDGSAYRRLLPQVASTEDVIETLKQRLMSGPPVQSDSTSTGPAPGRRERENDTTGMAGVWGGDACKWRRLLRGKSCEKREEHMSDTKAENCAPLPADNCANMSDVRGQIDRVDTALVDLIGERLGYVERAWQIKLEENSAANVPWRNQQVVDKVRARAEERGVPPDLVEALWRQMIGWFIQYEEEKLRQDR